MRKEEKLASDGSEDLKRHVALVIDRQSSRKDPKSTTELCMLLRKHSLNLSGKEKKNSEKIHTYDEKE